MDISKAFGPFTVFFDWMRNYQITLYGFSFTFMDVFVWSMFAGIVIWFIREIKGE